MSLQSKTFIEIILKTYDFYNVPEDIDGEPTQPTLKKTGMYFAYLDISDAAKFEYKNCSSYLESTNIFTSFFFSAKGYEFAKWIDSLDNDKIKQLEKDIDKAGLIFIFEAFCAKRKDYVFEHWSPDQIQFNY